MLTVISVFKTILSRIYLLYTNHLVFKGINKDLQTRSCILAVVKIN
jgi:hypothetical protein